MPRIEMTGDELSKPFEEGNYFAIRFHIQRVADPNIYRAEAHVIEVYSIKADAFWNEAVEFTLLSRTKQLSMGKNPYIVKNALAHMDKLIAKLKRENLYIEFHGRLKERASIRFKADGTPMWSGRQPWEITPEDYIRSTSAGAQRAINKAFHPDEKEPFDV